MKKHKKNRMFFGSSTVGERGQITIPKEAREVFNINEGDKILVFGDINKGLGLIKASELNGFAAKLFQAFEPNGSDKKNE
jgi:AbrB family looped-hinge helix DNA binding protein